jgi:hypothetical protein
MFVAPVNQKKSSSVGAKYIPRLRAFKEEELTLSYKHFVPNGTINQAATSGPDRLCVTDGSGAVS